MAVLGRQLSFLTHIGEGSREAGLCGAGPQETLISSTLDRLWREERRGQIHFFFQCYRPAWLWGTAISAPSVGLTPKRAEAFTMQHRVFPGHQSCESLA